MGMLGVKTNEFSLFTLTQVRFFNQNQMFIRNVAVGIMLASLFVHWWPNQTPVVTLLSTAAYNQRTKPIIEPALQYLEENELWLKENANVGPDAYKLTGGRFLAAGFGIFLVGCLLLAVTPMGGVVALFGT
mmetsp:Transcript_25887/g.28781  ORF Transcript_25887/g.28781 Transcript_25887/m.28781 type:complete len:131 (+) Transcript_25887:984-1376(+)